jgi:hypothetical protein
VAIAGNKYSQCILQQILQHGKDDASFEPQGTKGYQYDGQTKIAAIGEYGAQQ